MPKFGPSTAAVATWLIAASAAVVLVRLRKYVGLEPGYQPLTVQVRLRTREWSRTGQLGPARIKVDTDLARGDFFVTGVADLFKQYQIDGYQSAVDALKRQIADYQTWMRQEMLIRELKREQLVGDAILPLYECL